MYKRKMNMNACKKRIGTVFKWNQNSNRGTYFNVNAEENSELIFSPTEMSDGAFSVECIRVMHITLAEKLYGFHGVILPVSRILSANFRIYSQYHCRIIWRCIYVK